MIVCLGMVEYRGIKLKIDLLPENLDIFNKISEGLPVCFQGFNKKGYSLHVADEDTLVPVAIRDSRDRSRNEFVFEPAEKSGRLGWFLDDYLVKGGQRVLQFV